MIIPHLEANSGARLRIKTSNDFDSEPVFANKENIILNEKYLIQFLL